MREKNVLILGVSGQDGSYLAHYLIKKKYKVIGVSRKKSNISNHIKLGIEKKIIIKNFNYNDYDKMKSVIIKNNINQIYFLSGQPKPSLSDKNILETLYSNIIPVYNIIDIIINHKKNIKFFNSSSCEIFKVSNKKMDETSEKEPNSIYALSKLVSFEMVKFFREKFSLSICSGILFHHDSVLRDKNYVIQKIIKNVIKIKKDNKKKLMLGSIEISRDWGWAPEYVKVMFKILNQKKVDDYIIATGKTIKLKSVLDKVFKLNNLNWKNHVTTKKKFFRKYDSKIRNANVSKIKKNLGWEAKNSVDDVIKNLINKRLF